MEAFWFFSGIGVLLFLWGAGSALEAWAESKKHSDKEAPDAES